MKKLELLLFSLSFAVVFSSCERKKKKPVYVDMDSSMSEEIMYAQSGDEIVVPFRMLLRE